MFECSAACLPPGGCRMRRSDGRAGPWELPGPRRRGTGQKVQAGALNRVYGDPIQVWTDDDGRPTRFVWRGRLFTVLEMLEHKEISHEWWRRKGREDPGPAAGPGVLARAGVARQRCAARAL